MTFSWVLGVFGYVYIYGLLYSTLQYLILYRIVFVEDKLEDIWMETTATQLSCYPENCQDEFEKKKNCETPHSDLAVFYKTVSLGT